MLFRPVGAREREAKCGTEKAGQAGAATEQTAREDAEPVARADVMQR